MGDSSISGLKLEKGICRRCNRLFLKGEPDARINLIGFSPAMDVNHTHHASL